MESITKKLHRYGEASVQVYGDRTICDLIAIEPGVRIILDLASDPNPRANRWVAYEACKRLYKRLENKNMQLCSQRYYDAMIWGIDSLLSLSDGQDIMDPELYLDRWLASRPKPYNPDEEVEW